MALTDLASTLGVGAIAAGVAFGATPVVGRLAGILGMHDRPADRKLHNGVVPYLGGIAILSGWVVAFLTPGAFAESLVLVACMTVLALTGFADDRWDINPHLRLLIQIALACGAFAGGIRMSPTEMLVPDFLLTVLWLVGMTNAFNFMDNMDGLAAGVGGIGALFLGVSGMLFGQKLVMVLGLGLAGSCLGFLRHNFHPARIFMGDAGSLPLGFGLAALAIKVEFPSVHPLIAFAVPVVTLGLFVLDTCVMAIGRMNRGEPLVGGRLDHLSHRLLQKGYEVKSVALRMYAVAAGLGLFGTCLASLPQLLAFLLLAVVVAAATWGAVRALGWPVMHVAQFSAGHDSTLEPVAN